MRFTFLHAADLHLGSPLRGLTLRDEALGERVARASRDAFVELIDRALEEHIAFALFCGDIFDGDWRDAAIALFFNQQIARLHRAGIPVFLLRGNHDAESKLTRGQLIPPSAQLFSSRKAQSFKLPDIRVALHGRSFAEPAETQNLVRSLPPPEPGWFNIGVLHSALDGREGHQPYAPCSLEDLRARQYDYWALGHVHAFEVVARDPYVVFPGNLQGRSIRETGAKGAVLVDVAEGEVEQLRRIIVDRVRFAEIAIDASRFDDAPLLIGAVRDAVAAEALRAEGRPLAARIRLSGATALHASLTAEEPRWREEIEAAVQGAGDEVILERFKLATTPPAAAAALDSEFDLAALIDEAISEDDLRADARAALAQVAAKCPAPAPDLDAELDEILRAARALVLARAQQGGAA